MRNAKPASEDVEAAEVSRIADVGLSFDPDPFNARGDCRDAMLNVLRTSMDWGKLNEQQQRDINAAVNQTAEAIIAKLVKAIAAEGRDAVRAKVVSLNVKDGLKLQLEAAHDHDTLVLLGDLVGGHVSVIAADPEAFGHQRGEPQVDADQPSMPLGEPGDQDLVDAADPPEGETITGLTIQDGQRVNLKTGMVQRVKAEAADEEALTDTDWEDVRDATPDELAAERERIADFTDEDGGQGGEAKAA